MKTPGRCARCRPRRTSAAARRPRTRRLAQALEHRNGAAFARAVLHQPHARSHALDERVVVRLRQAVVRHHEQVDRTDEIVRAHQLPLFVPEEVAEIDQPELPVGHHAAHRGCVVVRRRRVWLLLDACAGRVRLAAAGQRVLQHRPGRGHDPPVEAGDRHPVSGLRHDVLGRAADLLVGGREVLDLFFRLGVRPVIDVVGDGDFLGQLLEPADVVDVIVRREEIVQLGDAGVAQHRQDARQIAFARVAGVDEQRLAGRRDEECRLAALGVGDVDVERLASLCRGRRPRRLRRGPAPKATVSADRRTTRFIRTSIELIGRSRRTGYSRNGLTKQRSNGGEFGVNGSKEINSSSFSPLTSLLRF